MARIAGVNLPREKRLEVALTYIYGIGPSTARGSADDLGLSPDEKVRDLTDQEVTKLRDYIDENLEVEGDLRRERSQADQAPDGDRLLPRHPPPPRAARPGPAHEDERAHPQGPEEDRRPREEGK